MRWTGCTARHAIPFLTDKVIGLISAAGGVRRSQAVNAMEFVVRARLRAVPLVLPIPALGRRSMRRGVRDPSTGAQLTALGQEVVRAARQMAAHGLRLPDRPALPRGRRLTDGRHLPRGDDDRRLRIWWK
jgi:hypothetical protein